MRRFTNARIDLESLSDRLVPSATTLDLTTEGAEAVAAGAIVRQVDAQPTGTGYIQSFVRVQGSSSGGGSQQGYNTSARPLQFDENKSPSFTRDLKLDAVPKVEVGGVVYREFLLDVNQKSSAPLLSLDEVRLYLGNSPGMTGYNPATRQFANMDAVYDMDAAGDVSVKLNYRLNHGSGSGDMVLLVPNSAFAGYGADAYVYLYSKMGSEAGQTANSGFEEWAVRGTGGYGGGAGLSSLSGFVYFDANDNGLKEDGEVGIGGVTIYLDGVNDLGQSVDLVAVTDENGAYSFTGLRAGEYTLLEVQPDSYIDGQDTAGTIDGSAVGTADNDRIFGIVLDFEQDGINYNFGELFSGS
jgi:hypothetical protein